MNTPLNTRILIVDDEEIVRDSIRESLRPAARPDTELSSAAAALFDETPAPASPPKASITFQIDEAATGQEGFSKVRAAVADGRPYAVVFLDVRMPGWDGLRTVQHIREVDTRVEVIFVTAYSDHSVEELVEKAGANVGYHCKPFSPEEIRQLATKGVHDWHKVRGLELLIEIIGNLRTREPETNLLLKNILGQVVHLVGTEAALIGRTDEEGKFRPLLGIGEWENPEQAGPVLELVGSLANCDPGGGVTLRGDLAILHVQPFRIAALLRHANAFNSEKTYLLRLFLSSASQALENARLQEAMLRSEKLSALGGALATIVHDLRNPIGNIETLCNLVDDAIAENRPADIQEFVPLIRESGKDAMGIVNDVLDFTRKGTIERAPTSLADFDRSLREKTRHLFEDGNARLDIHVPVDAIIEIDSPKLQRALVNLIKNACEACRDHRIAEPRITVSLRSTDRGVVIEVGDNGPGIPPALQERLFEPFATHGKKNGTGLGLAIVKQMIEAHNGTLTVQSSSTGAVFTLCLPSSGSV